MFRQLTRNASSRAHGLNYLLRTSTVGDVTEYVKCKLFLSSINKDCVHNNVISMARHWKTCQIRAFLSQLNESFSGLVTSVAKERELFLQLITCCFVRFCSKGFPFHSWWLE